MDIDSTTWKMIFKSCVKATENNSLLWLQYHLINRILDAIKHLICQVKILVQ